MQITKIVISKHNLIPIFDIRKPLMNPSSNPFNAFDELKAGLRFISTLLEEEAADLDRKGLIEHMKSQGVSQNQVYKTIKTLKELCLIEETEIKRGNVKSVYTMLTPKGKQVAELVQKIKQTLT